jgi:hypothetical protein
VNPSQRSAHICLQTVQSHEGAPSMRVHRVAAVQVRCSGGILSHPRCPLHSSLHQTLSTSSCVLPSQWVPGFDKCHPLDDRVSYSSAQIMFSHAFSSLEASKAPRHSRVTRHVLPSVQSVCRTTTGTQISLCCSGSLSLCDSNARIRSAYRPKAF